MPIHPARKAVALLVGIGEHHRSDRIAPLRYAGRDARSLARLLRDPEVCSFPRESVVLLTDGDATRSRMVRQLSRWLPEQAQGTELAFIYFAGHGVVEPMAGREEAFLVPHDADPDDILTTGIAMSDLARWIDGIEADAVVVCLDCCHAGGILPRDGVTLRATDRDMVLQPALLQRLGGKGRFLIASCDRGQKSIEADEFRHGLFTYHLLLGLKGAADRDGDGQVSVAELFGHVSAAVTRDARERYQREQSPWTSATYNGDVILSRVPAEPGEPTQPASLDTPAEKVAALPADEAELHEELRALRRRPDVKRLPIVFRGLAHRDESVRLRARRALNAHDWQAILKHTELLIRSANPDAVAAILEGLGALETHERVLELLDRLTAAASGSVRDRLIWLLDRKRLASERDRLSAIFRELHSPYEIIRVLGPGSCTGAYLARQEMTGLDVVVRVLRPEFVGHAVLRGQFLDLARVSVRLIHHNLVLTREVRAFPERDLYYTVRDYIPGATLREVLAFGRTFEPLQVCKILRQVAEALLPLHQEGLAHSGIKPSNVFLGREDRVVLGDPSLPMPPTSWDLPRLAQDFRYTAPEVFRTPGKPHAPVSDLYSLGCLAHELFRGQPPFVSDSHFELIIRHDRDPVPVDRGTPLARAIDDFLHPLLRKATEARCANLEHLLAALAILEDRLRTTGPTSASLPTESYSPGMTMGGMVAGPPSSVHLLADQSLMEFEGRQSIVPLTQGDGAGQSLSLDYHAPAEAFRPEVPGYEILGEIGRGGMGAVYKARDLRLDRVVALKVIVSGRYAAASERARFQREGQLIASLQHPNILAIFELGEANGIPYLALEFCDGGSLARRMGQPMSSEQAARLVATLARAVSVAHARGVIHRDLKPANVLFTADDTPKITDFGLARRLDEEDRLTISGAMVGTPSYMAPEQAEGRKDIGPAVDIYGLGALLYECLTGQVPFRGSTMLETLDRLRHQKPVAPRQIVPGVPPALEAICMRALEKDPERRFASAADMADALTFEGPAGTASLGGLVVPDGVRSRARRPWWEFWRRDG